jgi:DtxR family transcriptional regulator, Mn-dependent transcriptional regulator
MPHTHFDEATEEYLEAIYRLEREGNGVTTSGLASELGVAPASVSGMLKKLAAEGYVEHRSRGEAKLTEKGLLIGVRVVRRHRLAERLLTDVLGMAWDEVHPEACMLEHAITARVEEYLVRLLGNPQVCPHGHPIPPADGSEPPHIGVPLAQIESGRRATVHGVTDEVPEILRYLGEVGLRPGADVTVISKAPLGGPVTVEVAEKHHAISLELARMVTVVPADEPEVATIDAAVVA